MKTSNHEYGEPSLQPSLNPRPPSPLDPSETSRKATLSACTWSNSNWKKKGINYVIVNWTTLLCINIVICSVKGFLLALSERAPRQSLLLLKPTQTPVMNELWNSLENYRIYNSQNRKKVTFPFICNQLRWLAKTLLSKHNPKRRFLCAKNPTGRGRWPRAPQNHKLRPGCNSFLLLTHCPGSLVLLPWAEERAAARPRALERLWTVSAWRVATGQGSAKSKISKYEAHVKAAQPEANRSSCQRLHLYSSTLSLGLF